MRTMTKPRRAWSVSLYCRHEGAVLLVRHKDLKKWVPLGGEMQAGETPLEAARRELLVEAGFEDVTFPAIHPVVGAPPGLLLYEEHEAGDDGTHLNFAFIVEVPHKGAQTNGSYMGSIWITSITELPEDTPPNVQEAMPYALTAGIR